MVNNTLLKQIAYCQRWEESEEGRGVRPDGYSIHKDKEHWAAFCDMHERKLPAKTPSIYSRQAGRLYICEVSDERARILLQKGSIRIHNNYFPKELTE